MLRFCTLLVLLCFCSIGFAQLSSTTNFAYRYAPNPDVALSQRMYTDSLQDVWELEVRFRFSSTFAAPTFRIYAGSGFADSSLTFLTALSEQHLLFTTDSLMRFRYPLPAKPDSLYALEVSLARPDTSYWFYSERISSFQFPLPKAIPTDNQQHTYLFAYATENKPLYLGYPRATAFFYDYKFQPALPPMSSGTAADADLPAPTPIFLSENKAIPTNRGLYFIQSDTTKMAGTTLLRTPSSYPKITSIEDFSGPLRYISTQDEWQDMKQAGFSKKAIDRFWLGASGEPELARVIIRQYYQRVMQANKLFVSYKEGWKTDQGMIYILYGPPSIVHQYADKQIWYYTKPQSNSEISFTFARARNLFDPEYYILIRQKSYARPYYQIVNSWRKGE